MKIFIVRGAFLNPFELQNYSPLVDEFDLRAVSSKYPLSEHIDLSFTKLWSPTDLPDFPFKFPILNRLFTDAHHLYGLENTVKGADIVHVAETYYGYTHQAILSKRRGYIKKIVSTVWETIPFNNEGIHGRKQYKRLARENIDHFIAVTQKAKDALTAEGVPSDKVTVIPMGVDVTRFKPTTRRKHKRNIQILCVSRLVPEKGVGDLLQSFLEIRKNFNHVSLTFVGNGPLRSDIAGYKNVYVKTIPYDKISQAYKDSDIFCLPSYSTKTWEEQYGMVLVEAMASGLPIITTPTGAISEVCGDAAMYTNPGDIASLTMNIEKLIYNESLRRKLGTMARHRAVDNFDRLKIAQKIAAIYHQTCR